MLVRGQISVAGGLGVIRAEKNRKGEPEQEPGIHLAANLARIFVYQGTVVSRLEAEVVTVVDSRRAVAFSFTS